MSADSPYIDEYGRHIGYCNGCGEETYLDQDCPFCLDGEVVPYDDDPNPDEWDGEPS